jgi:hypothetical protein
LEGR